MKTTWKIVRLPHCVGAQFALWMSGYKYGEVKDGRVCVSVEAEVFAPGTFLVVAKWKKTETRVHRILL